MDTFESLLGKVDKQVRDLQDEVATVRGENHGLRQFIRALEAERQVLHETIGKQDQIIRGVWERRDELAQQMQDQLLELRQLKAELTASSSMHSSTPVAPSVKQREAEDPESASLHNTRSNKQPGSPSSLEGRLRAVESIDTSPLPSRSSAEITAESKDARDQFPGFTILQHPGDKHYVDMSEEWLDPARPKDMGQSMRSYLTQLHASNKLPAILRPHVWKLSKIPERHATHSACSNADEKSTSSTIGSKGLASQLGFAEGTLQVPCNDSIVDTMMLVGIPESDLRVLPLAEGTPVGQGKASGGQFDLGDSRRDSLGCATFSENGKRLESPESVDGMSVGGTQNW